MQLLRELGRVEYVALTTHAYEHKLFVAPFSRKFPDAKVRFSICQWSVLASSSKLVLCPLLPFRFVRSHAQHRVP